MKKIIKKLIILQVAILISMHFCCANDTIKTDKNVKITYISNEGFLLEVGGKSILIDALFGDKQYGFCDIPDSAQLDAMTSAQEYFANVDLILASHGHIDHFHAPFVTKHLTNNKNGKFVSCEQAVIKLAETDNYINITPQLIEITPDSLGFLDTVVNGIELRVIRLIHGPYYVFDSVTGERINLHQKIQNLGFIININGVKIFHCGDSNASCISDYKHFRLDKENIDIAFLGRGFMWKPDCDGIDVIRDYIKPKHIILMHIHHDQNKGFIEVAQTVKDEFPSVKVFERRMDTKIYTID